MTALFLTEPSAQIPPHTALKAATTNRPVLALEMKLICNPIFIAGNNRYKDSKGYSVFLFGCFVFFFFYLSREGLCMFLLPYTVHAIGTNM